MIKQAMLACILGIDTATMSGLATGEHELHPDRKEWQLGVLFVSAGQDYSIVVDTLS